MGAVAVGVVVGLAVLLVGNAAVANYAAPTASRVSAIGTVQPAAAYFRGTAAPSQKFEAPLASQSEVVLATSQASGMWQSALAFTTGCVFAAAGLLLAMKPQATVKPLEGDSLAMFASTAMKDVPVAPDVLCKETDPNCMRRRFEAMLRRGQEKVTSAIEKCDGGATFRTDAWVREGGGGGISRVLANGKVWEKAGVNLSVIYGTFPPETVALARQRKAPYAMKLNEGESCKFFVVGLSCVMHPRNPHCPTMHFNYRYFETENGCSWFAGGTDITPVYIDEEDMRHFHGTYKKICDKYDPAFYPKFKKWADEYFLIKHRGETRGLGGIFFDDLCDRDPEQLFAFASECLMNVAESYVPIIEKHKNDPFTEEQKRWQLIRRGRYTEFNLVYDRGFIFGLKTGIGRMESIMMTVPEVARWEYNHQPTPGSEEDKIMQAFRVPREWV